MPRSPRRPAAALSLLLVLGIVDANAAPISSGPGGPVDDKPPGWDDPLGKNPQEIVAPPAVGWMIRVAHNNVAVGFEQGLLLTGALLVVLGVGGLKVLNPERSLERLTRRLTA